MFKVLLTTLLSFSLVKAKSTQTWAHTESDLPVDERAKFGELENGFRYVIYENAEPPGRVSLRLHVDAGSLAEADDQQGMAHFLEHMLFEGSKNYTAAELIPEMQRLGIAFGAHANAYTSFDETVYMLDLPNLEAKTLGLGFTVMRDFCDGALLQEEEVEAERGVILSEKNSRDSVDFRLMEKQFDYMLPNHLASQRFPIGIEETIKTTPQPRIKDFYTDFYDPRLMTFVVVGDIDAAVFEQKIKDAFSSLTSSEELAEMPTIGHIIEPAELTTAIFTDPEVDEEDISLTRCFDRISVPDTSENRAKALPIQIANAIINRRFEKIAKQEGSPINAGAAYKSTWFDEITFGSVYITPSEGKWKESVTVLEQEFRRAFEHGFTKAEFKEVTANIIKSAEVAVEAYDTRQSSGIAMAIIPSINDREVFTTPSTDLAVLQKTLGALTPADCHVAFKAFWDTPGKHLVLTTTEDSGNDSETLKALYRESQKTEVTAPEEAEDLEFAYNDFGNTSTIESETHIEDLDIHQLRLSNGILINLKKTDFEKGKIYMQTRLWGGQARAEKKGIANFSDTIINAGGLGKHDTDDLKQIFSGKLVGTSFYTDENAFIFNGLTNEEDLETQLKLISAYLTDSGYRSEALNIYRKSLPDLYQQLGQTLEGAFQQMSAYTHGGDLRYAVPSEEEAQNLSIEDAKSFVSGSLSKLFPVEISVVGDFGIDHTKKTLTKILGSLPTRLSPKIAPIKPLDELPALGSQKSFTYKSELDRAASVVAWRTSGLTDNIHEVRRLNILSAILTNRMREEVREKLGSSYSPYARARASEAFPNYGNISALSICKTEDIQKINDLLLKLGVDLATEGATADELDRALNPTLEQIDASLRQNSYWLETVVNRSQSEPKRLDWARSRTKDYSGITLEDVNALAKKYLNKENAVSYHLHPE